MPVRKLNPRQIASHGIIAQRSAETRRGQQALHHLRRDTGAEGAKDQSEEDRVDRRGEGGGTGRRREGIGQFPSLREGHGDSHHFLSRKLMDLIGGHHPPEPEQQRHHEHQETGPPRHRPQSLRHQTFSRTISMCIPVSRLANGRVRACSSFRRAENPKFGTNER